MLLRTKSNSAVPTLVEMAIPEAPQNLVGDNAYDSDKLDLELSRYGIQLISPHRRNRKNRTQDLRDFGTLIWPHFGRLIWPHLIYSDRSSYPVPASRDGEGDGQETQGGTV